LLVPVGFALLFLQGISEFIKRIAVLRGILPDTFKDAVPAMASPPQNSGPPSADSANAASARGDAK
jgi:hypothetical protein